MCVACFWKLVGLFCVGVEVCVAELSTRTSPAYLVLLRTAQFKRLFFTLISNCAILTVLIVLILLHSQCAKAFFRLTQRHTDSSPNDKATNRQNIYLNAKKMDRSFALSPNNFLPYPIPEEQILT